MDNQHWCEHEEKIVKYTILKYECHTKTVMIRIHSWFCPECGVHGAQSEIIDTLNILPTDFRTY